MIDADELFYNLRIAFVNKDDKSFVLLCNQQKAAKEIYGVVH